MSTSLLWISTVYCCLIFIQGHSADIQNIIKEDNIEGMCMKKADGNQIEAQCESNSNQLNRDVNAKTGGLPEIIEKVEEAVVVAQDKMKADDDPNETTQDPLDVLTKRDIENVSGELQSGNVITPTIPTLPPSPKLEKLPDIEVLLDEEEKMLNFVRDYVENETLRLEQLNKNLAHWITVSDYSMADPQGYLSVYLNCFHLLKRMAFDIPNEILNFSLYDTSFREEDLDQWDIYSEDHHLVSYLNSSPQKLELLDSLDAHGLLSLLNSNSELSVPESKLIDILSNTLLHKPLDFEELSSEDILLDSLLEYVSKLDQKNHTESSKRLIKSAKMKYPLSEKLATQSIV